ncbi:hypothetical protein ACOMHN_045080 [Nucella lapillus]
MTETQKETSIQPTTKSPEKGTDIHASLSEHPIRLPDSSQTSDLPFFMTSATSGYVKGEKCNRTNTVICTVDASYKLNVPEGHVALVSFPVFDMMWDYLSSIGGFAELASIHADGSIIPIWRYNSTRFIPPRLFNTSLSVRLFVPQGDTLIHGFKMVFSIHPTWQIPPQTSEGVFNCSVSFYHTFQDHFHCNLVPECPGEEDEGGHCPFSSEACNGSVAVSNKCYFHYQVEHASSWSEVRRKCQKLGGDLATIKTLAERDAFLDFLRMKNIMNPVYVGLQSFESSMPRIYAKSQVCEVSNTKHTHLLVLDLSEALLTLFNSTVLINYPKLSHLDLSHSALTSISQDGFSSLPNLKEIDLRGADIRHYPSNVFKQLTKLQKIFSGQFKLCCGELLPPELDESNCFAPEDEISSCADLLRSDTYRTFLWLFSVLSIVGNMGCLLTRAFYLKSKSLTAFSIFVSNLSMADLLMGLYLAMVGGADHVYRGRYIWFEESWKPSFACQLAGFLSFLSSETSALIICLITLDRFLVLTFPFSRLHFRQWSAAVACLLVWLLGFSLASVPLLPAASQWHFYSQTGICIPLPITRTSFKGRDYAFGIMIIFNLVLFILIASGQFMIYWTIRATSSVRSTSNKNKDLTIARRLVSVVVSDFLCWFPIGLLGLLAAHGTPVPGEVNVGMAIFVLPLNAALNPFLYTFNALMEIYKTRQEDRLLKQLEACTVTGTDSLN